MLSENADRATKKIAFFGEKGSFAHEATKNWLKCSEVTLVAGGLAAEVHHLLVSGEVEAGVLPIENTTGGPVDETLEVLIGKDFGAAGEKITDALYYPVVLNLLSTHTLGQIGKVYSHRFALHKVRPWLAKNLPKAVLAEVGSTGEAIRRAKREKNAAAVAGEHVGQEAGLRIIGRDLAGFKLGHPNFTTFAVISRAILPLRSESEQLRTACVFTLPHRSGSLHKALSVLADQKINLTKIHSIPIAERPGDYRFFIEFEGTVADQKMVQIRQSLQEVSQEFKYLGSYPLVQLRIVGADA